MKSEEEEVSIRTSESDSRFRDGHAALMRGTTSASAAVHAPPKIVTGIMRGANMAVSECLRYVGMDGRAGGRTDGRALLFEEEEMNDVTLNFLTKRTGRENSEPLHCPLPVVRRFYDKNAFTYPFSTFMSFY